LVLRINAYIRVHMSPPRHDIQIRFIRRKPDGTADTNPVNDDLLRIARINANTMRVVYVEQGTDGATIDYITCTTQQLLCYLYRLFWLITLDEDPFHSVKFYLPGFATFQMSTSAVQSYVPNLLDLVLSLCWNWPGIGHLPNEPVRNSSHSLVGSPHETADKRADENGAESR
jgi:hypothetical protein